MKHITLFIFLFSISVTFGQRKAEKIDASQLLTEIIITKKEGQNIKQLLLMPKEYWGAALEGTQFDNNEIISELESIFEDYLIVGCINVEFTMFSGLLKNDSDLKVINTEGEAILPIAKDAIDPKVQSMLDVMQPAMAQMVGQLGEKLEFVVFNNSGDQKILDSYEKGKLQFILNETEFTYRTPFSALVAPKYCPEDQEKLQGNWDYCPWHGVPLIYKN
ncbi:MAG: hypothetical protein KTR22_05655 [Flavobacteriaceae bacterium]|nr:hypothetical protein [Flavobacteriaceae bacterium]